MPKTTKPSTFKATLIHSPFRHSRASGNPGIQQITAWREVQTGLNQCFGDNETSIPGGSNMFNTLFITTLILLLVSSSNWPAPALPQQAMLADTQDDSSLIAQVRAAVFNEPSLKATEISIDSVDGVVRLKGYVTSQAEIDKAGDVARAVKGLKSFKNSLKVKYMTRLA